MILIACGMVRCVYIESSVGSLQPVIFHALVIILSIVLRLCTGNSCGRRYYVFVLKNALKFGTNAHLDLRMNCLDYGS